VRILHVISPAPLAPHRWSGPGPSDEHATPDAAICLLARAIKHRSDLEHHVLVIGSAAAARRAAALGIRVRYAVSLPLGIPSLGLSSLRRALDTLNPGAVFEWEGGAINASSLEALHSSPTFHINTLSGAIGHLAEFKPLAYLPACVCPVTPVTPVTAHASRGASARAELRTSLGVPDGTLLIALLGDHPNVASAIAFASMLGILHAAGIDAMGLASPAALQHDRAARLAAASGYIPRIISGGALPMLLQACDAAVLCPPGAHLRGEPRETEFIEGLEAALALGAGVPVIARTSEALQRLCGPHAQALLTKDSEPATLARALAGATPDMARAREFSVRIASLNNDGSQAVDVAATSMPSISSTPARDTCDGIIAALGDAISIVPFLRETSHFS